MTVVNLESLINGYVKEHLSPTEDERADISKRYIQLQGFLGERTFQNGSYARHTSITPVNDLDVIYQLPDEVTGSAYLSKAIIDPSKLDIHRIIETLVKELQEFYGSSATVKAQPHSVGIYFGSDDDFSIDVVPAIPADNEMFWVPEITHLSVLNRRQKYAEFAKGSVPPAANWIKSDPKGYIAQATQLDDQSEGRFRKTAKLVKRWQRRCRNENDGFPLKSFHFEIAVTELFKKSVHAGCLTVVKEVFEQIPELILKPRFRDRADATRFIDEYVTKFTPEERKLVLAYHEKALAELAAIATGSNDAAVATALWLFLGVQPQLSSKVSVSKALTGPPRSSRGLILRGLQPLNGREAQEKFLSDPEYGIKYSPSYTVRINANVTQDGFRPFNLLGRLNPLKKWRNLGFFVEYCDVPEPYDIKWKVKNTGAEAKRKGDLRGQIYDDEGDERRKENTRYWGNHYVECYIIKDGVCVAADHIDVDIGNDN